MVQNMLLSVLERPYIDQELSHHCMEQGHRDIAPELVHLCMEQGYCDTAPELAHHCMEQEHCDIEPDQNPVSVLALARVLKHGVQVRRYMVLLAVAVPYGCH
jgi:hypothetical protein